MSAALGQIELRLHKRIAAENDIKNLKPPALLSQAAMLEFQKLYNKKRVEYLEASISETHDMRVLIHAAIMMLGKESFERYVTIAWDSVRMDDELRQLLNEIDHSEAVARAKAAKNDKKQGELDGQLKLPLDDKSSAEAATDCTTMQMPTDINELTDAIEGMLMTLGLSGEEQEALYEQIGFNDIDELDDDQYREKNQNMWMLLRDMIAKQEAHLRVGEEQPDLTEEELAELNAELEALEGHTLSLVGDELIANIKQMILEGGIDDARTVLMHHFTQVAQLSADEAELNGRIDIVIQHCAPASEPSSLFEDVHEALQQEGAVAPPVADEERATGGWLTDDAEAMPTYEQSNIDLVDSEPEHTLRQNHLNKALTELTAAQKKRIKKMLRDTVSSSDDIDTAVLQMVKDKNDTATLMHCMGVAKDVIHFLDGEQSQELAEPTEKPDELAKLEADIVKRVELLDLPIEELQQLYTEAGYDDSEERDVQVSKLKTVLRRLKAIKAPGKSKTNKAKATEDAT